MDYSWSGNGKLHTWARNMSLVRDGSVVAELVVFVQVARWASISMRDGHAAGVSGDGKMYTRSGNTTQNNEVEVFLVAQIVRRWATISSGDGHGAGVSGDEKMHT